MVWDSNIHDVGRGQPASEPGSPESLEGVSSASCLPQMDNQDSPILSPWQPQEKDSEYPADWPEFTYLQLENEVPECGYDDMQLFANESQRQTGLNDGSNFGITRSEDVTGSGEMSFIEKDPRAQIEGQIAKEAPYSSLNTDTVQFHKMPSGHGPTLEGVAVSSEEKTPSEMPREGQLRRAAPAKSRRGKGKALGVSQKPQAIDLPRVTKKKREQREKSLLKKQKKVEEDSAKHSALPESLGVFPTNAHMHLLRRTKDEQQNRDEVTKGGGGCCFCSQWNLKCSVNEPCEGWRKLCKITEMSWDWRRRPTHQINEIMHRGPGLGELGSLQELINESMRSSLVCLDLAVPEDLRRKCHFAREDLDRHHCEIQSFQRAIFNLSAHGDIFSTEHVALVTNFELLCKNVRDAIREIDSITVQYAKRCKKGGDEPTGNHVLFKMALAWEGSSE